MVPRMKKFLALLFVIFAGAALAQDVVPNHAIPIGRGPGVIGWGVVGPCALGQVPTFQGPSADPICGAGGGGGGGTLGWVIATASPFNATGDGSTDDTAAIQAAIDFAAANGIQTIYLPKPSNCYKITTPLYLDPPGNMRVNFSNPPLASFSLVLQGEPGQGNHEDSFGSRICPSYSGAPFLIVGTGQGMKVSNITLSGRGGLQAGAYRCGRVPTPGPGGTGAPETGIYIAGGGGGSTRAEIQEVMIENTYYGIAIGLNNGALGDSNTFRKIFIVNTCTSVIYGSSQNFINTFIDCNFAGYGIGIDAKQGMEINVFGGDMSSINGKSEGVTTLTSVSAITATPSPNLFDYTFTATLSAPAYVPGNSYQYGDVVSSGGQVWWCLNFSPPCTNNTPSLANPASWEVFSNYLPILNAASIVTSHYGVIPLTITSYTQSTGAIALRIMPNWSFFYWGTNNAVTTGDLQNEIGTNPTIYMAEMATVMQGANINATGVHVENPSQPTTLLHSITFLNGSAANKFSNWRMNFNPAQIGSPTGNPASKAQYYVTQSHPTVWIDGIPAEFSGMALDVNGQEPWIIDINLLTGGTATLGGVAFKMDNTSFQYSPVVVRSYGQGSSLADSWSGPGGGPSMAFGTSWQVTPFIPITMGSGGNGVDGNRMRVNWGQGPSVGVRPAPYTTPCIRPADLNTLSGSLPAWSGTTIGGYVFGYPFLYGGQTYALCDWAIGMQASPLQPTLVQKSYLFTSAHNFYSMGQDMSAATNVPGMSWSYKGKSYWVYADQLTLSLMWPGLLVILNDGVTDIAYLVTGVYMPLGYMTVVRADNPNGDGLSGSKTVVIPGTVIRQQPYNIQYYATAGATGPTAGNGVGVTCPTGAPTASFSTVNGVVTHC
jgi:hypothetical protein